MPQHVFIQTDTSAASGLTRTSAFATDKAHSDAFSAELNKHIQPQSKTSTHSNETTQAKPAQGEPEAATTTQSEKNTVDDGNNLPLEKTAEHADNTSKAVENNETSEQETEVADEDTTIKVVTADSDTPPTENDIGEQSEQALPVNSQGVSSDKPIRAQVEVSQKAVDNAKAAPVIMTARAPTDKPQKTPDTDSSPQQPALKPSEHAGVSGKMLAAEFKPSNAVNTEDKPATSQSGKANSNLLFEQIITDKKGEPNLAASLEEKDKTTSKPMAIRADILDALQRKNGDKAVSMNVRNMIAAQMQEQSDKPAIARALLAAEHGKHETKAATSATTFSILTTATASTSGTIPAATVTAQGLSLPVQPAMQNPAWSQVMSSRVVWMAKEGVQQAQLRMTPANLGPVEVRLQLHNDQASVTFLAQHSATRDALEQALPRLRESFAEAGIELGHAEVGEQRQQDDGEAEYADDSHIFAQASVASDDIESEQEVEQPLGETTAGLSIYA